MDTPSPLEQASKVVWQALLAERDAAVLARQLATREWLAARRRWLEHLGVPLSGCWHGEHV